MKKAISMLSGLILALCLAGCITDTSPDPSVTISAAPGEELLFQVKVKQDSWVEQTWTITDSSGNALVVDKDFSRTSTTDDKNYIFTCRFTPPDQAEHYTVKFRVAYHLFMAARSEFSHEVRTWEIDVQ